MKSACLLALALALALAGFAVVANLQDEEHRRSTPALKKFIADFRLEGYSPK